MRFASVVAVLSFAVACRCFEPVIETLDGGPAGGGGTAGGGATGGGSATAGGSATGGGCGTASQCTQPSPAVSLCSSWQGDGGGYSCIDSACVFECTGGRTCSSAEDAGCLSCGAARACETTVGCNRTAVAVVDSDNGCPGSLPTDLTLTPLVNACGWSVTDTTTGRTVGTVYQLSDGTYLAHVAELGGTCVGFSLPTQVERWLLSCPACQLELRL